MKGQTIHYILHTRSTTKEMQAYCAHGTAEVTEFGYRSHPKAVDTATWGAAYFLRIMAENSGAPHVPMANRLPKRITASMLSRPSWRPIDIGKVQPQRELIER